MELHGPGRSEVAARGLAHARQRCPSSAFPARRCRPRPRGAHCECWRRSTRPSISPGPAKGATGPSPRGALIAPHPTALAVGWRSQRGLAASGCQEHGAHTRLGTEGSAEHFRRQAVNPPVLPAGWSRVATRRPRSPVATAWELGRWEWVGGRGRATPGRGEGHRPLRCTSGGPPVATLRACSFHPGTRRTLPPPPSPPSFFPVSLAWMYRTTEPRMKQFTMDSMWGYLSGLATLMLFSLMLRYWSTECSVPVMARSFFSSTVICGTGRRDGHHGRAVGLHPGARQHKGASSGASDRPPAPAQEAHDAPPSQPAS